MIKQDTLNKIHQLLDEGKFDIAVDAQMDILKHGYNWSIDFIRKCLKDGKIFDGKELYPDNKKRYSRYYCIHKPHPWSFKLIIIGFLILKNILIIHISPLNKGSKEGKIYYGNNL